MKKKSINQNTKKMKKIALIFFLTSLCSFLFGQKTVKLELAIGNNYGFKFDKAGFSIAVPFEFTKRLSNFSTALQYARKHNLAAEEAPYRTETKIVNYLMVDSLNNYFYRVRQFKLDYIQIPIEYKQYFNERKEMFFKIGGYLSYAINGKVSHFEYAKKENILGAPDYSPAKIYSSNAFRNLSFSEQKIKKWDKGYVLGLGFTIFYIDITCRYEQSFANLNYSNDIYKQMKNKELYLVVNAPLFSIKRENPSKKQE